jgi:hypothetical protein
MTPDPQTLRYRPFGAPIAFASLKVLGGWSMTTGMRSARPNASRWERKRIDRPKLDHPRAPDREGEINRDRPVSFAPFLAIRVVAQNGEVRPFAVIRTGFLHRRTC